MARQTVGRTALGAAVCRLIEQYQPVQIRLFDDPVTTHLVNTIVARLMHFSSIRNFTINQTDAVAKGIYGAQICRTRFIDEAVIAALSQGAEQIVILGAGLDTRPYRLPGVERVKVFEIDLSSVQNIKKKRLHNYLGHLPDHVTFIPIDFDTQTLEAVFAETAFDPSQTTLFIWEGVTQYISEQAIRQVFVFVGNAAPDSSIVFTYVLKSIIERRSDIPGAAHLMDVMTQQSPWIFGLEPAELAVFLKQFNLTLKADVGNADYQARYLKPPGRSLAVFEGERTALASVHL